MGIEEDIYHMALLSTFAPMISVKEPSDLLLPTMAACTLLDRLDYKSFHASLLQIQKFKINTWCS